MTTQVETTIEVRGLARRYGDVHALRGIDFAVRRGEIVGFLGPNGAGKSTTMKILTCYLAASAGEAFVAGRSVLADPIGVRRRIGYLPESVPLYDTMLVYDYLDHMARMRGVPSPDRADRVAAVVRDCGLGPMVGKRIDELSKGYRQRVGLAQAMVHAPDVLILDEPTSGLDPNQIIEIRELIRRIGREKTVLLSTHVLQEIEALCDRILIIDQGRLVADGTFETLYAEHPDVGRSLETLFLKLTGHSVRGGTEADSQPADRAAKAAASLQVAVSDAAEHGGERPHPPTEGGDA